MALDYEPTVWSPGDVVTAEKMNKLEQGVASGGGGAFVVTFSMEENSGEISADKSVAEIYEACSNGKFVVGLVTFDNDSIYQFYLLSCGPTGASFASLPTVGLTVQEQSIEMCYNDETLQDEISLYSDAYPPQSSGDDPETSQ